MACREKTSPLEDWMNLIAKMPWWGALALASYVHLHSLATRAPVTTFKPGGITGLMFTSMAGGAWPWWASSWFELASNRRTPGYAQAGEHTYEFPACGSQRSLIEIIQVKVGKPIISLKAAEVFEMQIAKKPRHRR